MRCLYTLQLCSAVGFAIVRTIRSGLETLELPKPPGLLKLIIIMPRDVRAQYGFRKCSELELSPKMDMTTHVWGNTYFNTPRVAWLNRAIKQTVSKRLMTLTLLFPFAVVDIDVRFINLANVKLMTCDLSASHFRAGLIRSMVRNSTCRSSCLDEICSRDA